MVYVFWAFFAGLIIYLRREDKREGYPLESDRSDRVRVEGFPAMPKPKVFQLADGHRFEAPNGDRDDRPIRAVPTGSWSGAPLEPVGDPMLAEVGPGAYAMRAAVPERTASGAPRVRPMRIATEFHVEKRDPDPRGMTVIGADGRSAGKVCDVWVDVAESQARYLEVELGEGGAGKHVLLPLALSRIDVGQRRVKVASILASQFAQVPAIADHDQVTMLEEERISAYYGSGHLYAVPSRQESLV